MWAADSHGFQLKHGVHCLQTHYQGAKFLWSMADIHKNCGLSAGGQYVSTWVHKRMAGLKQSLVKAGLAPPLQSMPYAGSARATDGWNMQEPVLSTSVALIKNEMTDL